MCFMSMGRPGPAINNSAARSASAAADAAINERRSAQGFSASVLGGLSPTNGPSLARQMLLGI